MTPSITIKKRDTQYNYIRDNDIHHNDTRSCFAECHYAECRYAECRGAVKETFFFTRASNRTQDILVFLTLFH
jgi:hypothetical protein